MKSIALLALLGVITAKHSSHGVLMAHTACPPHEPLCNDREDTFIHPMWTKSLVQKKACPDHEPLCDDRDNTGLRPMWTKSLAQGMPGVNCPEHEPLCYNASASALAQGMPGVKCPEHEPLCYNASASALAQKSHRHTIKNSLIQKAEPCEEALEMSPAEMAIQMDYFSRSFDIKHYNNAMKIFAELKKSGYSQPGPKVSTWELYNKSFSFERVRKYPNVADWMNQLEQFEDNLNTNISNSVLVNNFVSTAKKIQASLGEKYHNGEWTDPASHDPQAEHKKTWANM